MKKSIRNLKSIPIFRRFFQNFILFLGGVEDLYTNLPQTAIEIEVSKNFLYPWLQVYDIYTGYFTIKVFSIMTNNIMLL